MALEAVMSSQKKAATAQWVDAANKKLSIELNKKQYHGRSESWEG